MSAFARLIPYLSLIERALPGRVVDHAAKDLGRMLSKIQRSRRLAARKNARMLGLEDVEGIAERTIFNWTLSLSDQLKSLWMTKERLLGMVEDHASANLGKALAEGRGVVLVTAHLGNYELAGSWLAALGFPVHAVIEEIGGGHSDEMERIRRRFGMGVILESDLDGMLDVLRKGEILVLLADRALGRGGMTMRFGKGWRRIPAGPALLSLRTDAVVQTGYFVMTGKTGYYRCVINPHFEIQTRGSLREKTIAMTGRVVGELVRAVTRYPDQWFAFQDEWEKLDETR